MKKILIDMDDVLCYSVDRVVELYNKEFGTNYSIEDFHGWNLASYATNDIYKYYGMECLHFFRDLKPIQEMIDLVHELISEGNEVVIVTSINKNNFEGIIDKTSWVETYLPDISDMLIVESKESVEGDVLIDDGAHNLKAAQQLTRSSLIDPGIEIIRTIRESIQQQTLKSISRLFNIYIYLADNLLSERKLP